MLPVVRAWLEEDEDEDLEDEDRGLKDRDLFIECFTDLGVVDSTSARSRDVMRRITRTAIERNLRAAANGEDLRQHSATISVKNELCRNANWLMHVRGVYITTMEGSQSRRAVRLLAQPRPLAKSRPSRSAQASVVRASRPEWGHPHRVNPPYPRSLASLFGGAPIPLLNDASEIYIYESD